MLRPMTDARASSGIGPVATRLLRALLFAALPLALFGPIVLRGDVFLAQLPTALEPYRTELPDVSERARAGQNYTQSDRLYPVLTDQLAMRRALRAGALPTWEPRLGLGTPLYAQSIAGTAYPPNWLAFVVPPERAAAPLAALGMFLAGLGAWLFLGRLGLGFGARAFGVVAFQLGGFGVSNLYDYMKFDAALWLPWSLWAIEGIARGKRGAGFALTVSVAASLVAGMVQIGALIVSAVAVYAALRLTPLARLLGAGNSDEDTDGPHAHVAPLVSGACFLVLGGLAAAVFLLPILEASRSSSRQWKPAVELQSESLPLATLAGTVVHDFVGTPTEATPSGQLPVAWWITPPDEAYAAEHANQLEWNTYAGAVVVALALVALVAVPRRASLPLLLLLGALGFAQGWPGARLLYGLPGLNAGAPNRALAIAWFLWPWLGALGVQALVERRPRALRAFVSVAVLAGVVGLAFAVSVDPVDWATSLESTLVSRYDELTSVERVRARLPFDDTVAAGERLQSALGLFSITAAALATIACALHVATRRGLRTAWIPVPIVLLVVFEGWIASAGHATARPLETALFPPSPTIDAIARAAGDGRVIRFDPTGSGVDDVVDLARPNGLAPYGISDAMPWTVFPPRSFNELFGALDPLSRKGQGVSRLSDAALLAHPILDLVRAQAVLSRDALEHPRLEPVLERDGMHVYRRSGAFGPARFVSAAVTTAGGTATLTALRTRSVDLTTTTILADETTETNAPADAAPGTVRSFERPAPNRIRVEVEAATPGYLVIHEQFYPGWRASVNGASAKLLRADHVYQAVRVPAGASVVELHFAPASLQRGMFLSVAALIAAAFFSRRFAA